MNPLILLLSLVMPVSGNDLLGTWETDGYYHVTGVDEEGFATLSPMTIRMTFKENLSMQIEFHYEDVSRQFVDLPSNQQPPELSMFLFYEGSYEVSGRQVFTDLNVTEFTVGGMEPLEGMLQFMRAILSPLEGNGLIPAEEYPDFVEKTLSDYRKSFNEESLKDSMTLDLNIIEYERHFDRLWIYRNAYLEWTFDPIPTAIRPTSWGQLKQKDG